MIRNKKARFYIPLISNIYTTQEVVDRIKDLVEKEDSNQVGNRSNLVVEMNERDLIKTYRVYYNSEEVFYYNGNPTDSKFNFSRNWQKKLEQLVIEKLSN